MSKFRKYSQILPKLDFSQVGLSGFKREAGTQLPPNIPPPPLVPKLPLTRVQSEIVFPYFFQQQFRSDTSQALSYAVMEGVKEETVKKETEKLSSKRQNLRKLSGRAPYVRHRCKCKYLNLPATKHLHHTHRCSAELCKMLTGFREQKNWKERMRVAGLKDHQKDLKNLLESSGIKPKHGRWTEQVILTTAAEFVESLQSEISLRKGQGYVEGLKPFRDYNEDNFNGRKVKKHPNCFLRFSVKMRNSFKEVLLAYLFKSEEERKEKVIDNRLVTKLISRTWGNAPRFRKSEERWRNMDKEEMRFWEELARKLAPEVIHNELSLDIV